MKIIDWSEKDNSYFLGFFYADGSLSEYTRNRGKATIEIKSCDEHILDTFKSMFLEYNPSIRVRHRNTNFGEITTSTFTICSREFRNELLKTGLNYGKKSNNVKKPLVDISINDFIRGFIDGDGSVGFSKKGIPFISITTQSDNMKDALVNFIYENTGQKILCSRNLRDDIYNITIFRHNAKKISKLLYYTDCIALTRKLKNANKIKEWESEYKEKRVTRWTLEEIEIIKNNTLKKSIELTGRTEKSIKIKLWRIK